MPIFLTEEEADIFEDFHSSNDDVSDELADIYGWACSPDIQLCLDKLFYDKYILHLDSYELFINNMNQIDADVSEKNQVIRAVDDFYSQSN